MRTFGGSAGYYFSGAFVISGSLVMCLIDVHKHNLRTRHKSHRQHSKKSLGNGILTSSLASQADPASSSHHQQSIIQPDPNTPASFGPKQASVAEAFERKMSFSEQDDVLPPVSLLSHQRSFVYDDLIDDLNIGKPEISIFSEGEEGIADMDLPDHLFIDELEYLDNITSCDKVENCVMLSEYEQNLIKETETPTPTRRRKWSSLFKQPQLHNASGEKVRIGVGGLRQSSFTAEAGVPLSKMTSSSSPRNRDTATAIREIPTFPNTASWRLPSSYAGPKRSITVIEEAV